MGHDFPLAFHTVRITAAHTVVGFGSQLRSGGDARASALGRGIS